jgi:hypothetical protein
MINSPRSAANSLVRSPLAARVYRFSTKTRMLLLTVIHVDRRYACFESICLIRFFKRVDVMANLNFGWGEPDCSCHVALETINGTAILA